MIIPSLKLKLGCKTRTLHKLKKFQSNKLEIKGVKDMLGIWYSLDLVVSKRTFVKILLLTMAMEEMIEPLRDGA
jgi:hypothetical protein